MARSILMVLALVAVVNANCPSGWSYNDATQHCYQFNGVRGQGGTKNWVSAKQACAAQGAYLVAIEDEPEAAFLTAQSDLHTDTYLPRYWTGANKIGGKWYWDEGEDGLVAMSDLLWAVGEPEDRPDLGTADFVVYHEDGMGWSPEGRTIGGIHTVTRPGKFDNPYVCEKSA